MAKRVKQARVYLEVTVAEDAPVPYIASARVRRGSFWDISNDDLNAPRLDTGLACEAETFDEARELLLRTVRTSPSWEWVRPYIFGVPEHDKGNWWMHAQEAMRAVSSTVSFYLDLLGKRR